MAQHDGVVTNQTMPDARADINAALLALFTQHSGATEPTPNYSYQPWADTSAGLMKQRNAADTGWLVRGTLAETFVIARGSNTILGAADYLRSFRATASFTQTLTAAATLGDGWECAYRIESGSTTTFDPNGAELINGASTLVIIGPAAGFIKCDGTGFYTYGFPTGMLSASVEDQVVAGGVIPTSKDLGTITTGTVTPNPGARALQHYINGGAHTLGVSGNAGSTLLDITNNGSAGAITTSAFTKVVGDVFTTTNGHKFRCSITIGNAGSLLSVQAMQ